MNYLDELAPKDVTVQQERSSLIVGHVKDLGALIRHTDDPDRTLELVQLALRDVVADRPGTT